MWGRTCDEAIGKNCLELGYEPWHAEMHDREIDQVIATGKPIRGEVPFTGTYGRRIYDYIFVPVFGATAKSRRSPARRATSPSASSRGLAARGRPPQGRVPGDAGARAAQSAGADPQRGPRCCKADDATEDNVRVAREVIERQVQHMARLVDDCSTSRASRAARSKLRNERVSLRRGDRRRARDRRAARSRPATTLVVELPRRRPAARRRSDCGWRRCSRTCSTTPPSTRRRAARITLRARARRRHRRCRVRDTGIGIAPEVLPRMFELFTHVHPSDRIKSGLGIGLALVRSWSSCTAARIEVRSDGARQGSEFIVTLAGARPPSSGAQAAASRPPHADADAPPARAGRRRQRDAAESLGMLLELVGARCRMALRRPAGARSARDASSPTSCCSTSACPAWTATRSRARMRADRRGRERRAGRAHRLGPGRRQETRRRRRLRPTPDQAGRPRPVRPA